MSRKRQKNPITEPEMTKKWPSYKISRNHLDFQNTWSIVKRKKMPIDSLRLYLRFWKSFHMCWVIWGSEGNNLQDLHESTTRKLNHVRIQLYIDKHIWFRFINVLVWVFFLDHSVRINSYVSEKKTILKAPY